MRAYIHIRGLAVVSTGGLARGFAALLVQGVSDEEAAAPVLARETALGRLWYRPDKAFETPKAVVYLNIESPAAYSSPEASVLTRIFTKLLNDSLNELAYPADLAGVPQTWDVRVSAAFTCPCRSAPLYSTEVSPATHTVSRESLLLTNRQSRYRSPLQSFPCVNCFGLFCFHIMKGG